MVTENPELSDGAFRAASIRLDELVREFETLPYPAIREQIFELLAAVDTVHRIGLHRLIHMLSDQSQGGNIERAAEADVVVNAFLTLYDLLPSDPAHHDQVIAAREAPAPQRSAEGASNFIPLDQIKRAPVARRRVYHDVARLHEVPPGTTREVEAEGVRVLLANVDGTVYAVPNSCPGSMAPLSLGAFSPPVITCPWHNDAFDIRTGQRVDGTPGQPLNMLPVEIQGDVIKLAPAGRTAGLNGRRGQRP